MQLFRIQSFITHTNFIKQLTFTFIQKRFIGVMFFKLCSSITNGANVFIVLNLSIFLIIGLVKTALSLIFRPGNIINTLEAPILRLI